MNKFWIGIGLLLIILMCGIGGFLSAFYSSEETSTITIKEKWVKYQRDDQKYLFSDIEGNVYSIDDSLLLWTWDASDRYARIDEGQTYTITTYWWRVRILSWYPNAVRIGNAKGGNKL